MTALIAPSLLAQAAAAADQAEQNRHMSVELANNLATAGVFRMLVPTELGGTQAHPQDFFDTLVALGRADGAAGWVSMIGATTGMLSASLPAAWAQTIYGDNPNIITTGVTAPLGKATILGAELEVTGRWSWGSGSQVSQWICGGCFAFENGEQALNKHGQPQPLLVFFKADEVTIHDTWYASGLRGTGSNDIEVKQLRIPEGRWVTLGKRARVDAPLYQFPTFGLLALGVSAVAIGIALHALDEFLALARAKTPTGSQRSLSARSAVQKDIAQCQALIDAAMALTERNIRNAFNDAEQGKRLTMEHKAALRLAATNNAWSAVAAVDKVYHAAGGSSVFSDNPLQRCFRDVHVVTQHTMVAQPTLETVGKVLLGIDPQTML